jgi:hypothetical protein
MANQVEELEKRGRKSAGGAPGRGPQPRPVEVAVAPPAYTSAPEKLPVVNLGDLGKTVVTAGAGAVVTAVFITSLKGGAKWVGAAIGGTIGAVFLATSPVTSVPSDLGIGMLAGATSWTALDVTGKLQG